MDRHRDLGTHGAQHRSGETDALLSRQRRGVRRTVWLVAGLALLIYLLSILQGWYYS